jgi:hypothetical protein
MVRFLGRNKKKVLPGRGGRRKISRFKKDTMPKKPKCPVCKKKLTLVEQQMPCRCKKTFCTKHRLAASHDCTFNYIDSAKEKLKEGMPAATFRKVESV